MSLSSPKIRYFVVCILFFLLEPLSLAVPTHTFCTTPARCAERNRNDRFPIDGGTCSATSPPRGVKCTTNTSFVCAVDPNNNGYLCTCDYDMCSSSPYLSRPTINDFDYYNTECAAVYPSDQICGKNTVARDGRAACAGRDYTESESRCAANNKEPPCCAQPVTVLGNCYWDATIPNPSSPNVNGTVFSLASPRYQLFTWTPSEYMRKNRCISGAGQWFVLDLPAYTPVSLRDVIKNHPLDKKFYLAGPNADKFQVDLESLSCGSHTWTIISEAAVSNLAQQLPRHYTGVYYRAGPSWTFTRDCCSSTPTVALNSPINTMFPANYVYVPLNWTVSGNTCPGRGDYNRAIVWSSSPLSSFVSTLPTENGFPPNNVTNAVHQATFNVNEYYSSSGGGITPHITDPGGEDQYNCMDYVREFTWYAEARNQGSEVISPVGKSSEEKFIVAPEKVTVVGTTNPSACYDNETTPVELKITFEDYNLLADTFRFEFAGASSYVVEASQTPGYSSGVYDNKCTPNVSTGVASIPTITECNISVPMGQLGTGTHTLTVKRKNNECTSTYGVSMERSSGGTFSEDIVIGSGAQGTMTIEQDPNSSFQIVLATQDLEYSSELRIQYYEHLLADPSGTVCPSALGDYVMRGAPVGCVNDLVNSRVVCASESFLPTVAGRYCFRAVVVAGGGPCGATITPDLQADVYLVNTHILRYTPSSNVCTAGVIPTGDFINGVDVEFRHDQMLSDEQSFRAPTVGGTVSFGFWRLVGLPPINQVTATTTCANCIQDVPCLTPYVECGGDSVSGDYHAGPIGDLTFNTYMNLLRGGVPVPPAVYDIYMRMGESLTPDDWLTVMEGDVFAKGLEPNDCSHTALDGTFFDGGLMERSEGTPYEKDQDLDGIDDGPNSASEPFTGGYIFSAANVDGVDIEDLAVSPPNLPHYYLAEPNPVGRYVFDTADYIDTRFEVIKGVFGSFDVGRMENLSGANGNLDSGRVYYTNDSDVMQSLVDAGGYTQNSDGAAVVYYLGDTTLDFDNSIGFQNLSTDRVGNRTLIIITDQDVRINNTIGYSCWWNSVTGNYGCSDTGLEGGKDYSPVLTDFRGNIEATIVTLGYITVDDYDDNIDPATNISLAKLLKVTGGLVAFGEPNSDAIYFGRKLGDLSTRYPSEAVQYDTNLLYNVTNMERNSVEPVSKLTLSDVNIKYGY